MALNFPMNPINGQTYNGYVYSSSGDVWDKLPISSHASTHAQNGSDPLSLGTTAAAGVVQLVNSITNTSANGLAATPATVYSSYQAANNAYNYANAAYSLAADVGNTVSTNTPPGTIHQFAGINAPTGWLECNGASIDAATYSSLWSTLSRTVSDFTSTIASPGVFTTSVAHGLQVGDAVYITSTGSLGTKISTYTTYYVVTVPTTTTLTIALSRGGAGLQVTASTGVHTLYHAPYGIPAGSSTNFYLPDMRGKVPVGEAASGTFQSLGITGGAETHTLSANELAMHSHMFGADDQVASQGGYTSPGTFAYDATSSITGNGVHVITKNMYAGNGTTSSVAGGAAHNNLQPYIVVKYIIKY